jgi:hypothetical protein
LAHPALCHLFFDLTRAAAKMAMESLGFLWDATEKETEHIINNYDIEGADAALKRNKKLLERLVGAVYGKDSLVTKNALRIIKEGAANLLPIDDMEKVWKFGLPWDGRDGNDTNWRVHSESKNCTMHKLEITQ